MMTPEKKRLRVGILFGGRSGEHEVSLASAASVIRGLDPDKYCGMVHFEDLPVEPSVGALTARFAIMKVGVRFVKVGDGDKAFEVTSVEVNYLLFRKSTCPITEVG